MFTERAAISWFQGAAAQRGMTTDTDFLPLFFNSYAEQSLNYHSLVLVLTLIVNSLLSQAGDSDWKDFVWRKHECVVMLPGMPIQFTQKLPGDLEKLQMDVLGVDRKTSGYILLVTQNKALLLLTDQQREKTLDNMRDGYAEGFKLLKEDKIKHGTHPGRVWLIEKPNGLFSLSRGFLIEDRLYQLIVFGPRDLVDSKDAQRFFDSFKLLR